MLKKKRLELARAAQRRARQMRREQEAAEKANVAQWLSTATREIDEPLPRRPGATSTERSHAFRSRGREITIPHVRESCHPVIGHRILDLAVRHRRVRESCRYNLHRFGLIFGPGEYEGMKPLLKRPPSPRMVKFIKALQDKILHGGLKHVRWPRGKGKSTWVKIAIIWAALYGHKFFMVVVEKTKGMSQVVVEEVWKRIQTSPKLAADFPEFAILMRDVALTPQRMRVQTYMGRPTYMRMDVSKFHYYKLPTLKDMPHTGAIIAYRGADQTLRGINIESARPDFFFLDDPQTDEDAKNPETVAKIEDNIQGAVLGSGEISERISAVMASTPIEPDDVSERFADPKRHPEWHTETEPLVVRWGNEDLRDEYLRLLAADHAHEDAGMTASQKFYMEHRAEIEAGVEMMDDGDFNPENEVSAYQHALWLLDTMKHKRFYSEMQMEPRRDESVINITPKLVLSRIRKGAVAAKIPEDSVMAIATTDINPAYALTCTVVTFDARRTGLVVDHWRHPCRVGANMNDTEFHAAIYNLLAVVEADFVERGYDISDRMFHWGIDCSGAQYKSVNRFVYERHRRRDVPLDVYALRGLDNKMFNPRVSTRKFKEVPGRNDTVLVLDKETGYEHVNFNKDIYEYTAHRAWLSAVGAPGGLSLYELRGGGAAESHEEFALQVCGEQLKWKPDDPERDRVAFKWNDRVYPRHDYGDDVYMAYALAGFLGLAVEGMQPQTPRRKRRAIVGGKVN